MKVILAITCVCFALIVPALAQQQGDPPSAERGKALAGRWCGACHLVQLRLTTIDPPTFTAIANDPKKTPDYIRTFLLSPHKKDMPPIQLTPAQVEDLIAYLGTLKKP
jgi:mono/diheme cytochrome c family protein